jgi:hypothetical protein
MKSLQVSDIGLGRNIYANKQLDEFAVFQDSQSTRKAYLAETAELATKGEMNTGSGGLL